MSSNRSKETAWIFIEAVEQGIENIMNIFSVSKQSIDAGIL